MGKAATLAKTAGPVLSEPPEQARGLREAIAGAIRAEYSGSNSDQFWTKPAARAADRIMGIIETMGSMKP